MYSIYSNTLMDTTQQENDGQEEQLREAYVDKVLELAYNKGDKIFINIQEEALKTFVHSSK